MVVCMPDVPLPVESQATYTVATVAMQLRFKTKSRMLCYGAEFDAHQKSTQRAGPTSQTICSPLRRKHTQTFKQR